MRHSNAILALTSGALLLGGSALAQEPGAHDKPSVTAPGAASADQAQTQPIAPTTTNGDTPTPAREEQRDRAAKSGYNRPDEDSPYRNPHSLTRTQNGNPPPTARGHQTTTTIPRTGGPGEASEGSRDRPDVPSSHDAPKPYERPGQDLAPNQGNGTAKIDDHKHRRHAKDESRHAKPLTAQPEHPNRLIGPNGQSSGVATKQHTKHAKDEGRHHARTSAEPVRPNSIIGPNGSTEPGTDYDSARREHRPDESASHHKGDPAQPYHRPGPGHRQHLTTPGKPAVAMPNPRSLPNPQSGTMPNPQSGDMPNPQSGAMPNPQSKPTELPNPQSSSHATSRTAAPAPAAAPAEMPNPSAAEREPPERAAPAPVEHAPPEPAHAPGH